MKVNPEMVNVINIVNKEKDGQFQKRTQDAPFQGSVADIVSVENKQAAQSRIENVEEAKRLLAHVTDNLENVSSGLYTLNQQRVASLLS